MHDPRYDEKVVTSSFVDFANPREIDSGLGEVCVYSISVYPTQEMESVFKSNAPAVYTAIVLCIFVFTTLVFIIYDSCVRRRQAVIMKSATRTHAVVSSLFPDAVRDKVLAEQDSTHRGKVKEEKHQERKSTNAALYPEATVMFADLAGFTAWSSTRDPSEVFLVRSLRLD